MKRNGRSRSGVEAKRRTGRGEVSAKVVIICVNDGLSCETCAGRDGEVIDEDDVADYPGMTCDYVLSNGVLENKVASECRCVVRPATPRTKP